MIDVAGAGWLGVVLALLSGYAIGSFSSGYAVGSLSLDVALPSGRRASAP